ncbi:hypothetical protein Nepgr_012614 [Nepenthes gracilis]|uniref:Uncharacterized protein n=1 Tax=Nepenthes gracilis TaxID=150966 RepID=A0AAD3SGB1_NEPGR|nr:hypothetical protein Nepgr_012614 [Nepenthes gracilis]
MPPLLITSLWISVGLPQEQPSDHGVTILPVTQVCHRPCWPLARPPVTLNENDSGVVDTGENGGRKIQRRGSGWWSRDCSH